MKILELDIIRIGGTSYNGIVIDVLYLNCCYPNIDSSLFGVNVSTKFMYVNIFFKTIKIFDKTLKV